MCVITISVLLVFQCVTPHQIFLDKDYISYVLTNTVVKNNEDGYICDIACP